jgi:hypothetical protein
MNQIVRGTASRRRQLWPFVIIGLVALVFLAGCSKDLGRPYPNSPPETGVFVEGTLDTVSYAVKLYWWGQDTDGEVTGFYYKWTCADTAASPDTNWVFTTEKNGEFILPAPDGFALQTFWVKAVDNTGEEDPSPARQDFPMRNEMPSVALVGSSLPDTTLPAVTFVWNGTDPDGDNTIAYYMVWLDGQESDPLIVVGQDTTMGPDYIDSYGNRTLYIRAVDEAQGASGTDSHTWYVVAPVGNVLLVDDVPETVPGAAATDVFYRSLLDSLVPGAQYTVFDVASQGTFRSAKEVSLILPLFQQVVWYGDTRPTPSAALVTGESGIGEFLEGGGNIFLDGIALVGDDGSFSYGFAADYLGIDSLRTRYIDHTDPSSTNFDLLHGTIIRANDALGLDSIRVFGIYSGCEVMYPSADAQTLFYLPPGTYSGQTENYYIGVLMQEPTYSSVCLTFPIRRCDGLANARQEVAKLLTILGVGQ